MEDTTMPAPTNVQEMLLKTTAVGRSSGRSMVRFPQMAMPIKKVQRRFSMFGAPPAPKSKTDRALELVQKTVATRRGNVASILDQSSLVLGPIAAGAFAKKLISQQGAGVPTKRIVLKTAQAREVVRAATINARASGLTAQLTQPMGTLLGKNAPTVFQQTNDEVMQHVMAARNAAAAGDKGTAAKETQAAAQAFTRHWSLGRSIHAEFQLRQKKAQAKTLLDQASHAESDGATAKAGYLRAKANKLLLRPNSATMPSGLQMSDAAGALKVQLPTGAPSQARELFASGEWVFDNQTGLGGMVGKGRPWVLHNSEMSGAMLSDVVNKSTAKIAVATKKATAAGMPVARAVRQLDDERWVFDNGSPFSGFSGMAAARLTGLSDDFNIPTSSIPGAGITSSGVVAGGTDASGNPLYSTPGVPSFMSTGGKSVLSTAADLYLQITKGKDAVAIAKANAQAQAAAAQAQANRPSVLSSPWFLGSAVVLLLGGAVIFSRK
jgi:hypothetical protein